MSDKPKGGALAKLAGMWCNDPHFRAWAGNRYPDGEPLLSEDAAADWMREICGIESRADLDHDEAAAERFQRLIRGPYMQHLQVAA